MSEFIAQSKPRYPLVIFDWDGTVIDSAARIVSSFKCAALSLGYPAPSDESIRNIIGLALPEAIVQVLPELEDENLEPMRSAYRRQYMETNTTPTALFEGAREGLERLKAMGCRLAVATGKSRTGLDQVLAETDTADLFEITRCADETQSKPHPQMLFEILEQTGAALSDAVMIGDTSYDLEMAKRAGMDRVSVTYGVHDAARLRTFEPNFEAESFQSLVAWLEQK